MLLVLAVNLFVAQIHQGRCNYRRHCRLRVEVVISFELSPSLVESVVVVAVVVAVVVVVGAVVVVVVD